MKVKKFFKITSFIVNLAASIWLYEIGVDVWIVLVAVLSVAIINFMDGLTTYE